MQKSLFCRSVSHLRFLGDNLHFNAIGQIPIQYISKLLAFICKSIAFFISSQCPICHLFQDLINLMKIQENVRNKELIVLRYLLWFSWRTPGFIQIYFSTVILMMDILFLFPQYLFGTEHKRLVASRPTSSVHSLTLIMENQCSVIAMAWTLNLENENWMCSIVTHNTGLDRIAVLTKWE